MPSTWPCRVSRILVMAADYRALAGGQQRKIVRLVSGVDLLDPLMEPPMLNSLAKPLVTLALLTAVGVGGAQAQTTPPSGDARQRPAVASQTTAPSGADARKLLGRNIK